MPSCCTSCVRAGCSQPGGRHQHQRASGCSLRLKVPPGPHTCRSTWPLLFNRGGCAASLWRSFTPLGPQLRVLSPEPQQACPGGSWARVGVGDREWLSISGKCCQGRGAVGSRAQNRRRGSLLLPAPCCVTEATFLCLCFFICKAGTSPPPASDRSPCWDWWAAAPRREVGGCRQPLGPLLSPQAQGRVLLLTICAAGIGGTFQFGYNLSIINAPTLVRTLRAHYHHPSVNSGPCRIFRPPSAWWSFLPRLHLHWAIPQALRVQIQLCTLP